MKIENCTWHENAPPLPKRQVLVAGFPGICFLVDEDKVEAHYNREYRIMFWVTLLIGVGFAMLIGLLLMMAYYWT